MSARASRVLAAPALVAIALLAGAPAGADNVVEEVLSDSDPDVLAQLAEHTRAYLRFEQAYRPERDFDGADVSSAQSTIRGSIRVPYARWGEVDLNGRLDVTDYEFDGRSRLVTGVERNGTPFDTLFSYRVRLGTNMKLADDWFLSAGGFNRSRFEEGAADEGQRAGVFIGAAWQPLPELFLGAGGAVQANVDNGNVIVSPLWRIQWQINERNDLLVNNLSGRVRAKLGGGVELHLRGAFRRRRYELDDRDSPGASDRLIERQAPVSLRLRYKLNKVWRLDAEAGAAFDVKLRTDNGNHYTIRENVVPFFSLGFRARY